MSDHPPIPPNCPYFRESHGAWLFQVAHMYPLEINAIVKDGPFPPVIAAVAAEYMKANTKNIS